MFAPSKEQTDFFNWIDVGEGNAVLEAVAGAGKTTTIIEGIRRMAGSVWFGAFNKDMAKEIEQKIENDDELSKRHNLNASTFHSIGFKTIRRSFENVKLDDKKVQKIAKSIVDNDRKDLEEYVTAVVAMVSMAKNRGIGALCSLQDDIVWQDLIESYNFDQKLPEDYRTDKVVKFAQVVLRRSNLETNIIDFDDMVYLPLQKDLRMDKFDWVLIDEAQDSNPTRRSLARKMMKNNARLVAVGDSHQAIFGFTGADNDSLEKIADYFNATYLPLTITFRCPKKVVEHAQFWVSHIESHSNAPEGELYNIQYSEILQELSQTHSYADTAVLCRYNKYLVDLCFTLIKQGIPARIEGRNIGNGLLKLAKRWKSINTLDKLEDKLEEYKEREIQKAIDKENESRADNIKDVVETLFVIIERARSLGYEKVSGLEEVIKDLFDDDNSSKNVITLSSVHRSKGREWKNVYILGRDELMPSKFAHKPWQLQQEMNLIYVALTRTMGKLVEVSGLKQDQEE